MLSFFFPVGFLLTVSLVMLSSIAIHFFLFQALWILAGIGLIVFFLFIDWRSFLNHHGLVAGAYFIAIAFLSFLLVWGPVIRNIKGWIQIGSFTYQPVEFVKLVLIVFYAHYFSRRHLSVAHFSTILRSFFIFIIPAGLTALQPDLGSSIILFGIWFGLLLLSGLPLRRLFLAVLIFAIIGVLLWSFGLMPYQKARIIGLFYPEKDVLGVNYSVAQAKIAIGSGGFWGKGYGQGSQTQLGFLSEPSQDFILAAVIEEWGWFVGILVIAAFVALIIGILRVGMVADKNFEKFICLGTATVFVLQFILNAGSTTGLLPVVGITFPFLSYGGSSLLTNFFLLGLVNSIRSHA